MLRATLQLICDDVRLEADTRKPIIIGLYLDAIVAFALPITIQPLTFFNAYEVDEVRSFHLVGQLRGPAGNVGPPVPLDLDIQQPGVVISIVKMSVQFETPGEYRFVMTEARNEGMIEIVKSFNVILATQTGVQHT